MPVYTPASVCESSSCFISSLILLLSVCLLNFSLSGGTLWWHFTVVPVCIPLITNTVEHLSHFLSIQVSSLVKYLFKSPAHFSIVLVYLFTRVCLLSLDMTLWLHVWPHSPPCCSLSLTLLMVSSDGKKFLVLI